MRQLIKPGIVLTVLMLAGMSAYGQNLQLTFSSGPSMTAARMNHHNVASPDGAYLLLGGHGTNFVSLSSCEVFSLDPDTMVGQNMHYFHDGAAITSLMDGRILIAGGAANLGVAPGYSTAEIYDPEAKTFSTVSNMNLPRMNSTAALIANGNVLIAGGWYDQSSATYGEIFHTETNQFTQTGAMVTPRSNPLIIPTADGGAAVFSGSPVYGGTYYENVEYYDSDSNTFSILKDNIFGADDPGWWPFPYSSYNRMMETQRLEDGSYLLMAYKEVASDYHYCLFTFNPENREFRKWNTKPELPAYSSHHYFPPLVDRENAIAYIPALKNGTDPVEMTFFAVNLNDTSLVLSSDYFEFPAGYYLSSAGFLLLSDGRILISGGHTQTGYYTNFSPHAYTLFVSPEYSATAIGGRTFPENYEFVLSNYPNPFNSSTTFEFSLNTAGSIRFEVLNSAGQKVYQNVEQSFNAGRNSLSWNADHLASGIYYARLISHDGIATRKIALIK